MNKYDILKRTELFDQLDPQAVEAIASVSDFITYPKNRLIFLNGDKASHIYIIISGWVKLYKTSFRGDETIIRMIGKEQIFGEMSCIAKQYHVLSAQAVDNVEILKIPQQEFLKAIKIDNNHHEIIAKWFFKRHFNLVSNFEKHSKLGIEEKIASFLLKISKDNGNCDKFELPYNKATLASQLSAKPETISRAFKYLKNNNLIEVQNKSVTIIKRDKLKEFCRL